MEIYVDGGVRKGSDIFKCLALGADFVFLGRGFLYSLIDGEEGIKKAF
jgi:isopentenyl diphosphate isomerase/L-lactate dehydrogenase-like FMN-dependent dehydrogenase